MDRAFFSVRYRRHDADIERTVRVEADSEESAARKVGARGHQVIDVELVEIAEGFSLANATRRMCAGIENRLGTGLGRYTIPAVAVLSGLLIVWAIVD